jgi:hypothetical protein
MSLYSSLIVGFSNLTTLFILLKDKLSLLLDTSLSLHHMTSLLYIMGLSPRALFSPQLILLVITIDS